MKNWISPPCASLLDVTDGNLGAHLRKLEEAGYIAVNKIFVERKPRTYVAATPTGRKVFSQHVAALKQFETASEASMNTIIQVDKLRKSYGTTVAVDDISFEVKEGEIFGMVGPNGAGKTTTIECLEGLRRRIAASLRVLGVDPQHESQMLRIATGIQLQQSNLPERMKVWEALDLYSSFYPRAADWETLLVQLGLEEKRNAPFWQIIRWAKTDASSSRWLSCPILSWCSWMN